jgi:hypothetical protein
MIYLTANTQSNPVFTLFENTTLSGASYIINLYSNDDYTDNLFWLTGNTTTNQARYDRFPLTVNLNAGSYDYYVYQTTGNTLSLSGLTIDAIVETGLCEVSNPCGNTIFNDDKINIITFGECNNTTTTTTTEEPTTTTTTTMEPTTTTTTTEEPTTTTTTTVNPNFVPAFNFAVQWNLNTGDVQNFDQQDSDRNIFFNPAVFGLTSFTTSQEAYDFITDNQLNYVNIWCNVDQPMGQIGGNDIEDCCGFNGITCAEVESGYSPEPFPGWYDANCGIGCNPLNATVYSGGTVTVMTLTQYYQSLI